MKDRKKGFTLIELLAVIVILAIIAVIAVPTILNIVEKARKSAAIDSAYGYLEAVEKQIAINEIKGENQILDGVYEVPFDDKYNVNVKGEKPISGTVTIDSKGKVASAYLKIGKYYISCDDSTCSIFEPHIISYDANGGSGTMEDTMVSQPNSEQRLRKNAFTKRGYYFAGWKIQGQDLIYEDEGTITINKDIVLVAQWSDEPYVNLAADPAITLTENYTMPNMTSVSTTIVGEGTYYITASSLRAQGSPGKTYGAFDGSVDGSNVWHSESGDATGWTQIRLPYMFQLKEFYLQNRNSPYEYNIHELKVEGSNNGIDYVVIGTYTNPSNSSSARNKFMVDYDYNGNGYQYYKFSSLSSYSSEYVVIGELTLTGNKYSEADTFKSWIEYLTDNPQYITYDEILKVIDFYNQLSESEKEEVTNHYNQLWILTKRLLESMINTSTINDATHNFNLIDDVYNKCKNIDLNLRSNMTNVNNFISDVENKYNEFSLNYNTKNQISYTLSASSTLDGGMAIGDIFDGSVGVWDSWHSTQGVSQWVRMDFQQNVIIYSFDIQNRAGDQAMNGFKLQGLNADNQWIDLQSFNNRNGASVKTSFDVTYLYDDNGYKSYRWQSTSSYGSYIAIGEMNINMFIVKN